MWLLGFCACSKYCQRDVTHVEAETCVPRHTWRKHCQPPSPLLIIFREAGWGEVRVPCVSESWRGGDLHTDGAGFMKTSWALTDGQHMNNCLVEHKVVRSVVPWKIQAWVAYLQWKVWQVTTNIFSRRTQQVVLSAGIVSHWIICAKH